MDSHDPENIDTVLKYCEGSTRNLYGDGIEDFMKSLQHRWSTASC